MTGQSARAAAFTPSMGCSHMVASLHLAGSCAPLQPEVVVVVVEVDVDVDVVVDEVHELHIFGHARFM